MSPSERSDLETTTEGLDGVGPSGTRPAEALLGTTLSMTTETPPTESLSNRSSAERPCGHCGDAIGLLPLAGGTDFYCSIGCLIFADDYPERTGEDNEGGET